MCLLCDSHSGESNGRGALDGVASFATCSDGRVTTWTPGAEALFGRGADEAIGQSVEMIAGVALDRPLRPGMVEARTSHPDGSPLVTVLTVSQIDDEAGARALGWTARDITLERDHELLRQQLAVIRDQVSDAILTVDGEGRVAELNRAAEQLYGCPRAEAIGQRAATLLGQHADTATTVLLQRGEESEGSLIFASGRDDQRALRDAEFLERSWVAFAQSLDLERTLEQVPAAFVPDFADLCLIYSLEDGGGLRVRASASERPDLRRLAEQLRDVQRPPDASVEALLAGAPIEGHLDLDAMTARSTSPAERAAAAQLGEIWRTTLPLRTHDGLWGIAVLLLQAPRPPLDAAELRLAQKLGDRAGQALANACLFANAAAARARFTRAFESAPSGMLLVRADRAALGTVTEANPAICEITGRSRDALVGSTLIDLHDPDERAAAEESLSWLVSGELDRYAGERRFQRPDGHVVWVQLRAAQLDDEAGPHVLVQVQDITDRKRYEGQLQFLADHDPLTGLYNRRRFVEELEWVIAYSRRYRAPAAIVMLDIDNFKFVNDTFGHATGDELLGVLGETLRSRCRDTDIAGRLGGDEFGVILPQCGREEADLVAQSLLDAVRDHAVVIAGERRVRATVSIGVRLVGPATSLTAEEVLSDADIALYDAKEGGRDRLSITGDGGVVTDRLRARLGWSERIREALAEDRFELFEQPIVAIGSGHVAGSEMLLRMRDVDGSIIAPGMFLDVAERFGQIQAIDCWVVARAIRLLAERQAAGIDLELEVNLSGGSLTETTVVDFILSEVRNAPIDPTRLTFEVTETAAIVNIDRARSLAQNLSDLGCRFALDDFGSGFGSFYYLKHLPFDVVKIDGEFIKELESSEADRLTVQAIVQIARGLGKPTIAEFVENEATLRLLSTIGVDFAQGYHLGRPRPVILDPEFAVAR